MGLLASLRSVRNWQQLGKFCAVGAVGYLINLAVYDALLHAGLHYLLAATKPGKVWGDALLLSSL